MNRTNFEKKEFYRIQDLFYDFVGKDKSNDFIVSRIVFLKNEQLEKTFSQFFQHLAERAMKRETKRKNLQL